jgi:hypothetical protein
MAMGTTTIDERRSFERLHRGPILGKISCMATTRAAAVRKVASDESEGEVSLMKIVQSTPKMSPLMERLYREGHLRPATRDLASLGQPVARPTKMSLTAALQLDRGEGSLAR